MEKELNGQPGWCNSVMRSGELGVTDKELGNFDSLKSTCLEV